MSDKKRNFPVAVVGMQGRFPAAYDAKDFWTNLHDGNDTIGLIPKERWDWEKLFGSSANDSEKTSINCAGFMPLADRFDHRFFGIMPKEAESMDPQQRLFMQTAYAALEDAGYAPSSLAGSKTGVFVGIGNADYSMMMQRDSAAFNVYRATGMALTCIANKLSFFLDIHGPSESIDTACSGSLVAIHRAIQSMQFGECERAIIGGVNLLLGPDLFLAFDKAGMLSKSGRCRTFDASANGYVRGEGVAALVLCPLDVAEKNGDYIYGVIQGSAENHGGRAHSFTAPNASAQASVIQDAWERSGFDFRQACIIETHGTGTPLGDPIEVSALKKVAAALSATEDDASERKSNIALGALKSHVGHLEATAGVAGVIKSILSMKYRTIPANLNHTSLNPHIDLDGTPFHVPCKNISLDKQTYKASELIAGISSFGFGGVNAHIVVQSHEAQQADVVSSEQSPYLIPLSAKDPTSLNNRVLQLIGFLEEAGSKTSKKYDVSEVTNTLCEALDISVDDLVKAGSITLFSLNLSVNQWTRALKNIAYVIGRVIKFKEIRDCISVQEAAQRIVKILNAERIIKTSVPQGLCTRVAVPTQEMAAVSLGQIAYGLMTGRDTMKERLVFVVHSKDELLMTLRGYIEEQEDLKSAWWRHSIKHKDPVLVKPQAVSTSDVLTYMKNWAQYWVATKAAALKWNDLYPQEATPSKFPLPSYPFRLDRSWYQPSAAEQLESSSITNTKPLIVEKVTSSLSENNVVQASPVMTIPKELISAWNACWKKSHVALPESSMSFIYLLEYALHKNHGKLVYLKNLVLGRPSLLKDNQLVYQYVESRGRKLVQCIDKYNLQRVVAQARFEYPGPNEIFNQATEEIAPQLTSLNEQSFYQSLQNDGICIVPIFRNIKNIEVNESCLEMSLNLPDWQVKSSQFWVPLVTTFYAGIFFLMNKTSNVKNILLPWKISSVFFNPKIAKNSYKLIISVDQKSHQASVKMLDENSSKVLVINGITLRSQNVVTPIALALKNDVVTNLSDELIKKVNQS